jgi:hypothetical protein
VDAGEHGSAGALRELAGRAAPPSTQLLGIDLGDPQQLHET